MVSFGLGLILLAKFRILLEVERKVCCGAFYYTTGSDSEIYCSYY
jgi:hypothetical protein